MLFNISGKIVNSSVDGTLIIKNYMPTTPIMKLGLSKNIVIGKANK